MSVSTSSNKIKKAAAISFLLLPLALLAQTVAAPVTAQPVSNENDTMWYLIIGVMAVLLFAILLLGNMLVTLAKLTLDKNKVKAAALILLLLVSGASFGQNSATLQPSTGSTLAANWNIIMASCVLLAELFSIVVLLIRIRKMLEELSDKKVEKPVFEIQLPKLFDNINASVPIEKEKDILLDHNYDGIQELDNNLPPWWKYSFYLSIVFAICYFSYYHILGGPSSKDEYDTAVRQAKEQQEEYTRLNANKVDENTVTLADAAGIDEGKTIFAANCAACHGAAAGGVVGPNLTDDYWLHGGSLSDVFKSVKNGWPAKGMKSWQSDLSPVQIKNVVSYIKTLNGTNPPNAKAPQGDLYKSADSNPRQGSADSTKVKSI